MSTNGTMASATYKVLAVGNAPRNAVNKAPHNGTNEKS
ncbi:hypothetical protein SDC9_211866 [bioreactor metagenome]|uniref:Uncharacterized protein n=1 Tax=bioreactor metagenome TaxID=1076179 RepID=A0A645JKA4_9ZZZZ